MSAQIIGLCGRLEDLTGREIGVKGVGKDTVALMIRELHPEARIFSFATPLKLAIAAAYGLDLEKLDTPEHKESIIPALGVSWRYLLEFYGTEVARQKVHTKLADLGCVPTDDVWIRKMQHRIAALTLTPLERLTKTTFEVSDAEAFTGEVMTRFGCNFAQLVETTREAMVEAKMPLPPVGRQDVAPIVLIPDVRFPNEMKALQAVGGKIVQVYRRDDRAESGYAHLSNQVLHDPSIITLENHGGLEDLKKSVQDLAARLLDPATEL